MKGILVLEDGTVFDGISIAATGDVVGEVVLNTAVVGYQEMLTDPSNAGKILVFTYPLIGNYGVAEKFNESSSVWVGGVALKEESRIYSNWQAEGSFADFLKSNKAIAISGIDTRTLAVHIRNSGQMLGVISTRTSNKNELLQKIEQHKKKSDYIKYISVKKAIEIKTGHSGPVIAVLDLGMLNSFTKQLKDLGCRITLLPYNTNAEKIISMKPDGLVISNGPEEDISIPEITATVKKLLGKIPLLGISTGHQIIGLALGGKLKKLKIGHHGVNYPVKGADSFKGEITVQNHSFVIDESSLKTKRDVKITLRNINDETIEEMESKTLKFISIQYYPVSPGFNEINETFRRFLKMTRPASKANYSEVQYAKA